MDNAACVKSVGVVATMISTRMAAAMLAVSCGVFMNGLYAAAPVEGAYIRERDSGVLMVKKSDEGKLVFQLDSYGANGHSCSVDGTIIEGIGYDSAEAACQIAFKQLAPSKLEVQPITYEECRQYCGMRAYLDGEYVIPPATCTTKGVKVRRNQFLKLYRGRDYTRAAEKVKLLIAECGWFIDWITIDDIRNDLAIAQFHAGDPDACRQTLAETLAAGYSDVQELKDNLPPADADSYERVAKATFYNRGLCSKSTKRK